MALNLNEWNIQSRATHCATTGRPFVEGETVHTALYWKAGAYQRLDVCEEAWAQRNENIAPLSSWKFAYQPPPPPPPEALKKDDAESLLRHLMQENDPTKRNARYILTLMLERKKILKMLDRQKNGDATILIYEHLPTGETWFIEDPHLRLTELEPVQMEVAALLHSGGLNPPAAAEPTPATTETLPEVTETSAESTATEDVATTDEPVAEETASTDPEQASEEERHF